MHRFIAVLLAACIALGTGCRSRPGDADANALAAVLTPADEKLLDELERTAFLYFWEQADPDTGLVLDRARTDGRPSAANPNAANIASIAATGFGLTALCIAHQREYAPRKEIHARVLTTLRFLHDKLPHEHGFFYHFIDKRTGQRVWNCELSSIDTALLLAGVLTAKQHFADDAELNRLATTLFNRVDWPWMLGAAGPETRNREPTLSMGWTPEKGFLKSRWDRFCEHPILYLPAIGSSTHPLPTETWHAWPRTRITYAGRTFMQEPPLFVHQFPHAWIDFRHTRNQFRGKGDIPPYDVDHWQNSVDATLAHRQFCIDLAAQSPDEAFAYSQNLWGITASDSRKGYRAWGGPPATPDIDGSVVPCAPAGSLPFAPRQCLDVLHHIRETYPAAWSRYGFTDAFHPASGWINPDVIGIDVGIAMLMAENLRTDFVWKTYMKNHEIRDGMRKAGFR